MNLIKNILVVFSLLLLLACSKQNQNTTTDEPTAVVLAQKKAEILNYINSFPCSAAVGCSSIAFGDKPCGGPWEYLVFSNAVNLTQLQQMVASYNDLNKLYNQTSGAASDCMFVSPPSNVGCVNGQCGVIN